MKDRIDYYETPEFQKDFRGLAKKYRTLNEDFALAKKATIELYHLRKINNNAVFPIPELCRESIQVLKVKKFACRSLFGKGVKSGIRIIYAFYSESCRVDFIEIYYKGEQANENRGRIRDFLKGGVYKYGELSRNEEQGNK